VIEKRLILFRRGIELPWLWRSQRHGRSATHRGRFSEEVPVHVLWNIIVLIVVGLIAGFVARAVVPGKQAMSIGATIVLGIIGSVVGNLLGSLLFAPHRFELGTSGIIGSIIGAIVVLLIYLGVTGRNRRSVTR
jgi:uncharacterized membrane protein YeaQ/YmgE (transglycosylase-associated protein family)